MRDLFSLIIILIYLSESVILFILCFEPINATLVLMTLNFILLFSHHLFADVTLQSTQSKNVSLSSHIIIPLQ